MRERIALAIATVMIGGSFMGVPSWREHAADPCHIASIFALMTIVIMYITRLHGARGILFERMWSFVFLVGMPVIYIASWLVEGGGTAGATWLWVEMAGLPIYVALAVLGLKRSPWFLVAGIVAHGIAWDSWHIIVNSAYIPIWYSIGCLATDVGLGLYLAARVPAWRASDSLIDLGVTATTGP